MKPLRGKRNPWLKFIAWLHPAGEGKSKTYSPCGTDSNKAWDIMRSAARWTLSLWISKFRKWPVTRRLHIKIMTDRGGTEMEADKKKKEGKKAAGSGRYRYFILQMHFHYSSLLAFRWTVLPFLDHHPASQLQFLLEPLTMFMIANWLWEGMSIHKNVFLCINLHGALRLPGMQVHRAVKNPGVCVGQSVQFALNVFDNVVILCLNFRL